ncbi:MAG: H(+)-transporting ATPase, partial [Clostridia bacterium]|nr:H(+)-transporting ATPase [Clostridia bacterium]
LNYPHFRGVLGLVRSVLIMTLIFEAVGILIGLIVFARDYPLPQALGISAFHSISAFNNAGFDILPGDGLLFYQNNALLLLMTCVLTIAGSLGFFVIHDMVTKRRFRRFSLHSKVVLATSGGILLLGTLLLKATGNISWLTAFFVSAASRTSGFATFPTAGLGSAALLILMTLMFIGGSPGSTAGGIKTTTFFVLIRTISATISGKRIQAFHRSLPQDLSRRALVAAVLGIAVIIGSAILLCLAQPQHDFMPLLFEAVSAAATVGLSTGITPELSALAKIILIVTMFIGRLGLLTMATMWLEKSQVDVAYAEESVSIG